MAPQAEQRRLAWMAKQLDLAAGEEEPDPDLDLGPAPDTPGGRTAQRKLEKAARRLEVAARLLWSPCMPLIDTSTRQPSESAVGSHSRTSNRS